MNVLVALAWPNHIHHERAISWFLTVRDSGWATCPTTETGFIRVSSNVRAIPGARPPSEALELLARLRRTGTHHFWTDAVAPADDVHRVFGKLVGYRQVPDAHLLSIAIDHSGRLATFDRGLLDLAAPNTEHIELIG